MGSLTVRIPEQLEQQLELLCKQQQRSTSEVLRESLRQYISQAQLRLLREQLRPYAEARGFLTDEDVFKAVS